jgi:uncharacterized protein YjgD (DUF1641 family)
MAAPVDFRVLTPPDSRDDLVRRLQDAPVQHAEALLAMYELVQRLHDTGVIALLNGMLSAGDEVVARVVDLVSSKEAVNSLRVGLMLAELMGSIDVDKLSQALEPSVPGKEPSLWQLGKQATGKDARRGTSAALELLSVFGAALADRARGHNPETGKNENSEEPK